VAPVPTMSNASGAGPVSSRNRGERPHWHAAHLDLHGPQLPALLERRRVTTYVEVPFPTGTYDTFASDVTGSD
jgi:hypothetical protein